MPAEAPNVDPATFHLDAFGRQTTPLLDELDTAWHKRQATIHTHDPMPRQGNILTRFTQHVTNQTRSSRQPCPRRDLAVAGNATARDRLDHPADFRRPDYRWMRTIFTQNGGCTRRFAIGAIGDPIAKSEE